jgi:hypothetical protein
MRVLSTQAQHADTDLDVTMKFPIQFFRPTLAAVMAMTLVGCGGGGSGANDTREIAGTVTVYATGLNDPMHMVFDSSGNLYTANKGGNNIAKTTQARVTSFISGNSWSTPIGLALVGGNLYVSMNVATVPGVWKVNLSTGIASQPLEVNFTNSLNFSGVAADLAGNIFASDQSNDEVKFQSGFTPITAPTGLRQYGNFIYAVSYGNAGVVKKINISDYLINGDLGVTFSYPYSIDFDSSGNAYVVEFGSNGALSQISKVTQTGVKTTFAGPEKGLCASVGIAIRDDYVYVSNGICTSDASKSNRILKIAI